MIQMQELTTHIKSLLNEFYSKLDVKVEDIPVYNEEYDEEEEIEEEEE